MSMRQFLLKKKPAAMMLCLKDTAQSWYPSKLAQACGASYVYVTHWLDKLEKGGWVKMERKGRLKSVAATEAGLSVASSLDEMVRKIDALAAKSAAAPLVEGGEARKKEAEKEEKKEKKEQAGKGQE